MAELEALYATNPFTKKDKKQALAAKLGVEEKRVNNWFETRRKKDKDAQKKEGAGAGGGGPGKAAVKTKAPAAAVDDGTLAFHKLYIFRSIQVLKNLCLRRKEKKLCVSTQNL